MKRGGLAGVLADFGWYLSLKSVSDPCNTNGKQTCEIDSFRTTSCELEELSFWQRRTDGVKCFSDYARDTIQ